MPRRVLSKFDLSFIALLAIATVSLQFILQGWTGFNIGDEGFLWYGVQRVIAGEVPIRDFMSYDPGRYYWSASVLRFLGDDGIMSLRVAAAVFQTVGLTVSAILLLRTCSQMKVSGALLLITSCAIITLWMHPRHKLFDCAISIFLVATVASLYRRGSPRSFLLGGIIVGLISFFGRNHGLYGIIGVLGAEVLLSLRGFVPINSITRLMYFSCGLFIGWIPLVTMILVHPEFGSALWVDVLYYLEHGRTNLPLAVPWPWVAEDLREFVVGIFFSGIIAVPVISVGYVVASRLRGKEVSAEFVGAALMSIPYVHWMLSRSDTAHLSQSIHPMLMSLLIFIALSKQAKMQWSMLLLLAVLSIVAILPEHPGWRCLAEDRCEEMEISGVRLNVDKNVVADYKLLRELVHTYSPDGRPFFVAPLLPGAYALFKSRAPVWEFFPIFPRSEARQLRDIKRMKESNPRFALIQDIPLDGRDELRYRNTHPLIYRYLEENFKRVPLDGHSSFELFVPTK